MILEEYTRLRGWCVGGRRSEEEYKLFLLTFPGEVYEVRMGGNPSDQIDDIIRQGALAVEIDVIHIGIKKPELSVYFIASQVKILEV